MILPKHFKHFGVTGNRWIINYFCCLCMISSEINTVSTPLLLGKNRFFYKLLYVGLSLVPPEKPTRVLNTPGAQPMHNDAMLSL